MSEESNTYNKEYYHANRKAKLAVKVTCECGKVVCKSSMTKHKKSKKHTTYVANQAEEKALLAKCKKEANIETFDMLKQESWDYLQEQEEKATAGWKTHVCNRCQDDFKCRMCEQDTAGCVASGQAGTAHNGKQYHTCHFCWETPALPTDEE